MRSYPYEKYALCSDSTSVVAKEIDWKTFLNNYHKNQKILDVRSPNHYNIVHFNASLNLPFEKMNKISR